MLGEYVWIFFQASNQQIQIPLRKKKQSILKQTKKITPILSYYLCKPSSKLEFLGAFCSFTKLLGSWHFKSHHRCCWIVAMWRSVSRSGPFREIEKVGEMDTPNIGLVICWSGKCLFASEKTNHRENAGKIKLFGKLQRPVGGCRVSILPKITRRLFPNTPNWNAPLNLYQQAVTGFLS